MHSLIEKVELLERLIRDMNAATPIPDWMSGRELTVMNQAVDKCVDVVKVELAKAKKELAAAEEQEANEIALRDVELDMKDWADQVEAEKSSKKE